MKITKEQYLEYAKLEDSIYGLSRIFLDLAKEHLPSKYSFRGSHLTIDEIEVDEGLLVIDASHGYQGIGDDYSSLEIPLEYATSKDSFLEWIELEKLKIKEERIRKMDTKEPKDNQLFKFQKNHVDRIKFKLKDEPEILESITDALDLILWGHLMADEDFKKWNKLKQ